MPKLIDSPYKSISILYRKSHIWLNNSCEKYGLTGAQAAIILIACDCEATTQDEITKRTGLDKSVIAKTVAKLEKAGFLVRSTNPKDKRTYDIRPTEIAQQAYPYVKEEIDSIFHHMTQQMTNEERAEFKRLLLLASETTLAQDD